MSRSEGRVEAILPMEASSDILVMENLPVETGKASYPPEQGPVRKIHGFSVSLHEKCSGREAGYSFKRSGSW